MTNTISKYQRNAKRDDDASTWPVTIVESPFEADHIPWEERWEKAKDNIEYAERACLDCRARQEVPFASHLIFTGLPPVGTWEEDREFGITAGYALWYSASKVAFYIDRGWSPGMERALKRAQERGFAIEYRSLDKAQT